MIDVDFSFFIQFANFLITLFVLNMLLIRPIRGIIAKRNDTMAGYVDETDTFTKSAEDKLKNYNATLDEARKAAAEQRNALKDEGTAEEQGILQGAQSEAAATLKAEREVVAGETKTAMDTLKAGIPGLAEKVTAKVLG